jgi:hypothetical protein
MTLYAIYVRARPGAGLRDRDLVTLKDGFSWPAFLVAPLWALRHRLWVAAAVMTAGFVVLAVIAAAAGLHPGGHVALGLGGALICGWLAHGLRARRLERLGYTLEGVVEALDATEAERGFLAGNPWVAELLGGAVRP